jgi:nitrate reductase NapD
MRAAEGGADPSPEIHIAGVLVLCRPLDLMRVSRAVDSLDAAEVFQSSVEGKLVVVIEAAASRDVVTVIDAIRGLPGVLDVALVYQHAEPAAAMQQAMDVEAPDATAAAGLQSLELRRIG